MTTSEEFIKKESEFGAHNYKPLPIVIAKGEGCWVYDVEGKKYLDMLAAYSALNQGHCNSAIISALKEQAEKLTLTSRAFYNDKLGEFLELLCSVTGLEMALPMNTGAEAVETALKAARKWGYKVKKVHSDKAEIIVCHGNFHGRTISIISFSSEQDYKGDFGPFTPGFKIIPFGDIHALEQAITENTVAFLFEPVQGEGGINIPEDGYLKEVRKLCTEKNILMMADEIQVGFARTGKMFACDHEEVKPDVLILGKALGGGALPVSAVVSSKEVLGLFKPGQHGSTFGGNPLSAAVGIAAIKEIQEKNLSEKSAELGDYFKEKLQAIESPYVKEVRGRGLFIAVEIKKEHGPARPFCEKLEKEGILCKETHEQVIRFAPPLIITKEEIDWALERIEKVLK